jgi:hypothetical protein
LKDGSTIWERRRAPVAFGPTLQDGVLYAPLAQPVEEVAVVPGEALGHLRHLPQYAPTYVALDPATGPTPLVWKGRLILAFKRRLVAVGEAAVARSPNSAK